ncbi:MAG: 4'-phosphopantetheinyl transferase superfamily protein [Saprospiraceae bacterium]|nr:4'-phosphopantetheinyl transferase superfamily protein [Saprospiraceae bacterium]
MEVQHVFASKVELGLWRITESELWFLEQLLLSAEEDAYIAAMKGHRRLEWLAGRWALHVLSGRAKRGALYKDEFGKPYLENSVYDISISHSRQYVAVMAGPKKVGVDIQKLVPKISRLAAKYLRDIELENLNEDSGYEEMHIYWGAKECLYKAYGRRQLDFKKNIAVEPFDYHRDGDSLKGWIKKDNFFQEYWLKYEVMENFMLVYGMEI